MTSHERALQTIDTYQAFAGVLSDWGLPDEEAVFAAQNARALSYLWFMRPKASFQATQPAEKKPEPSTSREEG